MTFEDCLLSVQRKLGRPLTEDEINALHEQWQRMADEADQQLIQQQAQAWCDRVGGK
jgi:hypothetical protein